MKRRYLLEIEMNEGSTREFVDWLGLLDGVPGGDVVSVNPGARVAPVAAAAVDASADPRIVRRADNGGIDVEASLRRLGLTRDQLLGRSWPRGTAECSVKLSATRPRKTEI